MNPNKGDFSVCTLPNGEQFGVQRVKTAGRRCIFISDVHGEAELLQALLDKVGFGPDDLLFLLGDLCEKGTDSLAALRLAMRLCEGGNVFPLQGNCDVWNKELNPARETPWLLGYLMGRAKTLVADLCREQGIPLNEHTDMDAMKQALWSAYQPELRFLDSLPRVIETDRAILVHAAIERETPPYVQKAHTLVKYDLFMERAPAFQKWVVCGHLPVLNYCRTIGDCRPRVDEQKHIWSIDGGNVINGCGQLNALIVEGERVCTTSVDKLPEVTATGAQAASEDPIVVNWYHSAVEVLERRGGAAICRHKDSGRVLTVPEEKLYRLRGSEEQQLGTFTDYRLPVAPGDRLKLWEEYGPWALCKKDGVLGWVRRALLRP